MKVRVVTSMSRKLHDAYGRDFLDGASHWWPSRWKLVVHSEDTLPLHTLRQHDSVVWMGGFAADLATKPPAWADGKTERPCWKPKERLNGYSFKSDALRFLPKVRAIAYEAKKSHDILVWLDADVVTIERPPEDLWVRLLRDAYLGYLPRPNYHAETGCIVFRLPQAKLAIDRWLGLYDTGRIYGLEQQHDAFAFDVALNDVLEENPGFTVRAMATGTGHVWEVSPLSPWFRHDKGPRKHLRSKEVKA